MKRSTKRALVFSGTALSLAAAGAAVMGGRAVVRRLNNRYSFAGKTVLITGGSRGLGLILAREFAREGARVAICARDPEELEIARADLTRRGAQVLAVTCDLTDTLAIGEMVRQVRGQWGPIDVLVNNAGVIQVGPMEVMTDADYDRAMKTHFWAPLHATLAVLPDMRLRGGRIVNITSIGGKISVPHLLPYCASKFALVGFSQGLRSELTKDNIYVTTVCPGLMRTGSPRNAFFKGKHKAEYAWFSVSDSLPLLSMDAERAARQIVRASRRGTAEIVLSLPAKLAVLFHGVFPGVTAGLLAASNRLMPASGGIGEREAQGKDSESFVSRSPLTALNRKAERMNNQLAS